jgi:putative ABC transport system permease protein
MRASAGSPSPSTQAAAPDERKGRAMSFIAMVLKNLLRQPVRTGLTVLGISIGITTVVALGVITGSFKSSAAEILRAGGADFMVAQKGSSDLSLSTVTDAERDAIAARPDVARATGVLIYIVRVGDNPYFPILGIRPDDLSTVDLKIQAGELLPVGAPNQVMLGSRAARELGASVGDQVILDKQPFTVVGIYNSGNTFQDAGGFVSLDVVRQAARREGTLTMIYVTAANGYEPQQVADAIEQAMPQVTAISQMSEFNEVDQGMEIMDAANLAISVLAVGIGAIGVMNTMVMSVFERTREIGILRAVGWHGRRILQMIVGESLVLCVVAAAVGLLFGVAAVRAVLLIPTVQSFIEPEFTVAIVVRALFIAVLVALAGAAYPAFRAIRLTPMEALRYE